MTNHLFQPLTQREITFRNRIAVSPMCQYSSEDGFANDWHLVHLGSRAVGGAGLVMMEASAVEARGPHLARDHGIWKDEHIEMLSRIAAFLKQGALPEFNSPTPAARAAAASMGRRRQYPAPRRMADGRAQAIPFAPTPYPPSFKKPKSTRW